MINKGRKITRDKKRHKDINMKNNLYVINIYEKLHKKCYQEFCLYYNCILSNTFKILRLIILRTC